ncbi:hypothetical protein OHB11_20945 [Streptomyces zaomyceticus]|uniref:hypothetical protein n=1 Tax=Streptomyces zaomyceticus TaxID=68286 RepID=UPI003254D05D
MAVSRAGKPVAGRRFPTGANYVEALQNPTLCFEDPDLKSGSVQQSPVLGPKAISGNFASVFSITAPGGQRHALKCFTRDSSTLEARYQAISKRLSGLKHAKLSQPWPVSLEYLPRGVLVAGQWYPALKMAWVEGTNLITWIDRNIRNAAAILGIAERFAALTADLEKLGIAHGDLQHGNLLVAADGTLRLVDYDGMYVPALKGQGTTESGHRNYQSPTRTSSDFGPTMDRFSSWVIYLALVSIATDPSIRDQLHDDEGEFLILKEDDFKEPESSMAWSLLLTHPDPALQALAAQTHGLLAPNAHAAPSLSAAVAAAPASVPAQRPAPAAAPAGGPPAWLTGHIPPPQNASAGSHGSSGSATATVRARALENWRASLEQRARQSAPTAVSVQERATIRQQFAAQKKRHEAEIAQAEGAARREREQLQQRITTRRQQVNKEKQQHQTATQRQRALLLQRQAQLTDAATTHARVVTQLATESTEHRRAFGLRRYLRLVATGR